MIALVDATLREGQQHGNIRFSKEDAVSIAKALDAFGVDFIEVGQPIISEQDYDTAIALCKAGLRAQTLAHARALLKDVEAAASVGSQWVGIFIGINETALRYKLHRTSDQVLEAVSTSVREAKRLGLSVRLTCEDASRTSLEWVSELFDRARSAGADRLSYADTVGVMLPSQMFSVVSLLTRRFGPVIHAHCHNDHGLATANALAAAAANAAALDVSIDGIGERCGIASLGEVAVGLTQLLKQQGNWRLSQVRLLSRHLQACLNGETIDTRAVTGRNCFAHKAGLHIAAAMQCPQAYEAFPPSLVGAQRQWVSSSLQGSVQLNTLSLNSKIVLLGFLGVVLMAPDANAFSDSNLKTCSQHSNT